MKNKTNEQLHHLEKVASDYCMSGLDVYDVLLTKNDDAFPLSFDTLRKKVIKDVPAYILEDIFTHEELKTIFIDINIKKIKNEQLRKLINTLN